MRENMFKILKNILAVAVTSSLLITSAFAGAVENWAKGEFSLSVLSEKERIAELKWFQKAAKPFKGMSLKVVSEGTDSHLFLLDLTDKNITGAEAEPTLGQANITLNKNSVPNDRRPPMITSGLRIGTPAITTRGFKESEVSALVELIVSILADIENQDQILLVKNQVQKLCKQFPVYNLI